MWYELEESWTFITFIIIVSTKNATMRVLLCHTITQLAGQQAGPTLIITQIHIFHQSKT